MSRENYKTDKLEYVLVGLLVCLSGNKAFTGDDRVEALLILSTVFLFGVFLIKDRCVISTRFHLILYLFAALFLAQGISFYFFPFVTVAGFIIRIFVGYAVVRLVRDFPRAYIDVLFYTSIISLFFYVPEQLLHAVGVSFKSFFEPIRQLVADPSGDFNILVYNFDIPREIHRNSAFFWEPGAFAGYVLLALIFLGLKKDTYFLWDYKIRFLILSGCLLTTLSTMGYAVFPLVLLLHFNPGARTKAEVIKLILVTLAGVPLLALFFYQTWQLDFMKEKISYQHEKVLKRAPGWEKARYGTLVYDWEYIKRRPLVGWGLHDKTRHKLHYGKGPKGQGNGLSGAIHKIGIFGFGIWAFYVWRGMRCLSGRKILRSLLALCGIFLMLNGENFLNFPLFWGLMFLDQGAGGHG